MVRGLAIPSAVEALAFLFCFLTRRRGVCAGEVLRGLKQVLHDLSMKNACLIAKRTPEALRGSPRLRVAHPDLSVPSGCFAGGYADQNKNAEATAHWDYCEFSGTRHDEAVAEASCLFFTTNQSRGHRACARLGRPSSPPGLKATPSPASLPPAPPSPRGGMPASLSRKRAFRATRKLASLASMHEKPSARSRTQSSLYGESRSAQATFSTIHGVSLRCQRLTVALGNEPKLTRSPSGHFVKCR